MAKRKNMPDEIFIFAADYLDDGTPVWTVVTNVNQIPEDAEGEIVGNYFLNKTAKFGLKRTLT